VSFLIRRSPLSAYEAGMKSRSASGLWALIRAIRTPVLIIGVLLVARNENVIRTLTLWGSYYGTEEGSVGSLLPLVRLDYWMYPVNLGVFFLGLLLAFALLEAKHRLLPANPDPGWDVLTGAACFIVAMLPPLLSTNIQPGRLQLWICLLQAVVLWIFMLCNAGLWAFHRYVAARGWFARFVALTFPVSDVLFYLFQRGRPGSHGTLLRLVPTLSYMTIVSVLLGLEVNLIATSGRAERIAMTAPRALEKPYFVVHDQNGFWFTNADSLDALSGLWYYDQRSGHASAYIRIYDPDTFQLEDDFFYFYDRFDSEVQKVDARTKR
jgi:hypothetical protein